MSLIGERPVTEEAPVQKEPPDQALSPRNREKAHALGLTSATGLVIGSIVGTGVFTMPAVIAGAGTMGIIVLGVIAVGAMLLAVLFGQLTRRVPNSDGGLYAYSRHEFGDFAGYLVGWCYWVQSWAGNAAIVSSWVFYVDALFGWGHNTGMENWAIAMVGLWVPAIVNLVGIRQMAWFQNVTVVLKFLPLLFVGVVGWFFVTSANFGPFNASGGSLYSGIGIAAGVALFSFIGVEAAAITAKRVKNPRVNVGRASVLGTALSAVLYVLVTAAVMGLVSHRALVNNGSPFVNAFQSIFPHEAWAGKFIAAIAVVSGIGALNGWTLIVTETSRAIAQDDLFPRPFAWVDLEEHRLVRHPGGDGAPVVAHAVAVHDELRAHRLHLPGRPHRGHGGHPVLHVGDRPAHLPALRSPACPGVAPRPRSVGRRCERSVLDVGDLRFRIPGRVPGAGGDPCRTGPVRLPERPPRASRRDERTGGSPGAGSGPDAVELTTAGEVAGTSGGGPSDATERCHRRGRAEVGNRGATRSAVHCRPGGLHGDRVVRIRDPHPDRLQRGD